MIKKNRIHKAIAALTHCAQRLAWLEHRFSECKGYGAALAEARRVLLKQGIKILDTGDVES